MMDAMNNNMVYCRGCGRQLHVTAVTCPGCGAPQMVPGMSDKKILPAFLLCFFVGIFGAHRFYVGKVGTGILQIFTLGGLGIWVMIDFILIMVGSFKDKQGNTLKQWT